MARTKHEKLAAEIKKANELKQLQEKLLEEKKSDDLALQAQLKIKRPVDNAEETEDEGFKVKLVSGGIDALLLAYKNEFKKEPERRPDGSCVYVFESMEEATIFFTEVAAQKQKFFCIEEGKGFSGHNFFSCGDGALYTGSLQDIIAGLKQSIEKDATNHLAKDGLALVTSYLPKAFANPTLEYRDSLGEKRKKPLEEKYDSPSPKPIPRGS